MLTNIQGGVEPHEPLTIHYQDQPTASGSGVRGSKIWADLIMYVPCAGNHSHMVAMVMLQCHGSLVGYSRSKKSTPLNYLYSSLTGWALWEDSWGRSGHYIRK